MENSNRRTRLTLLEQMSAVDDGRSNVTTLDAILGYPNSKRPDPPPSQNRTLLDIIREDVNVNVKDKKSWKVFRDKLRLKRAGSAWTSSIHIPTSDVNVHNKRSQFSTRGGGGSPAASSDQTVVNPRFQLARRPSVRMNNPIANDDEDDEEVDIGMPSDSPPSTSFRPQTVRQYPSTRISIDDEDDSDNEESPGSRQLGEVLAEEREISAREAVVSQEATEEAAEEEPVKMSLMDLLGESGSSYNVEDEEEGEFNEEDEDEDEDVAQKSNGKMECTCCVCMVRHKGSAFIPCGHTFCRLCSRELWVQRGNCPLCNGFILEILDIF